MLTPIEQEEGWQVRICRPAFQDFQRIFRRYYARSILNRQLLKLRWWNPDDPLIIDLQWNDVPDTNLMELLIEEGGSLSTGVRVYFFQHSPDPQNPTLWVLGGMEIDESFGDTQRSVYCGRSLIVKERAEKGDDDVCSD